MKKLVLSLSILSILSFSCSSDDDNGLDGTEVENQEEEINFARVILMADNGDEVILTAEVDGDEVVETEGELLPNTVYTGALELTNEVENDTLDEVIEEADDHQFFYLIDGGLDATSSYIDMDSQGNAFGSEFTIETGEASEGTLNVQLRHLPNKTAEGVQNGDPTNAGGETELNAVFPITIAAASAAEVTAAE